MKKRSGLAFLKINYNAWIVLTGKHLECNNLTSVYKLIMYDHGLTS